MKRWPQARRGSPGPAEIASVLECACKDQKPAVVLVRDTRELLCGHFQRLERSRVTLALDPSAGAVACRPLAVCCVTFAHDERAFVFLAPLWRVGRDPEAGDRRLLSVGLPGQMATLDVGSTRRIPLGPCPGLEVGIRAYDGREWAPEAVDLSATGILLDFGRKRPPRLPVGALLEISLALESLRVELTTVVRRREGALLGLSFVDPTSEALGEIRTRLEQRWLADAGS